MTLGRKVLNPVEKKIAEDICNKVNRQGYVRPEHTVALLGLLPIPKRRTLFDARKPKSATVVIRIKSAMIAITLIIP